MQAERGGATVAVVIPVLGDDVALAQLIGQLYALALPPDEIVAVDGAGSEACRRLCEQAAVRYAVSPPGRGAQLHAGSARASSSILWFLHADAAVPPGAVAMIRTAVAHGADGGHFRFRFAGPRSWHKRLLAAMINLRVRLGGVPYGDQGIFAMRAAYADAGGFPHVPLFEEVPLVRGLRRRGRFVTLDAAIDVSPRRWERDGWLRRSLENRLLAAAYMAGVSPQRLARRYARANGAAPGTARGAGS